MMCTSTTAAHRHDVLAVYRALLRVVRRIPTETRRNVALNRIHTDFRANSSAPAAIDLLSQSHITSSSSSSTSNDVHHTANSQEHITDPPVGSREFLLLTAQEQLDQLEIICAHLSNLKRCDDHRVPGATLIPVDINEQSSQDEKTSRWGRWTTSAAGDRVRSATHLQNTLDPTNRDQDRAMLRDQVREKLSLLRTQHKNTHCTEKSP